MDWLTTHAGTVRDLALTGAAIIGTILGWWRVRLADMKDAREREERREQAETNERSERDYWHTRFYGAMRSVLDETEKGTIRDAARVHALEEVAWIAEKHGDPLLMSRARLLTEQLDAVVKAKWRLEKNKPRGGIEEKAINEGRLPIIHKILYGAEEERLTALEAWFREVERTAGAEEEIFRRAATYREKWKPPEEEEGETSEQGRASRGS